MKDSTRILKRYAFLARKRGYLVRGERNGGGWTKLANACGASVGSKGDAKLFLARLFGHPEVYQPAGPVTYLVGGPKKKQRTVIDANTDSFLQSYEWRRVRMEVLKRDGARCACCGATPKDGIRVHVDHIKPRKHYPSLALDPANLQVLCEVCNHGKGNWDKTDWREKDELPTEQVSHLRSIK